MSQNILQLGLFTKIIAQSGAALDEWSIDFNPVYNARGIAELADCDVSKPVDDIVQCLKDVDALKLTRAYKDKWKVCLAVLIRPSILFLIVLVIFSQAIRDC